MALPAGRTPVVELKRVGGRAVSVVTHAALLEDVLSMGMLGGELLVGVARKAVAPEAECSAPADRVALRAS